MGVRALVVSWTEPAEDNFDLLVSYIAVENPAAAKRLWDRVMSAIERAAAFPDMAPYIPELGRSYREILVVRPFRVVYRIEGNILRVITVMRQEQDFDPERFLEE